jgi:hypothetical protein
LHLLFHQKSFLTGKKF